jgi:hypothetical protein
VAAGHFNACMGLPLDGHMVSHTVRGALWRPSHTCWHPIHRQHCPADAACPSLMVL